ncbi:MAG TPA: hypothetical protein VM686_19320, partial [Polyangiaceae bacterium]|nr:hypothetical protein [Polyangiaceae bacterium]
MPVALTYPGVYVEEIPSGVRNITGVGTSVTAFIGFTARGPINKPTPVSNFGEFERHFGGLSRDSEIGYAVQQFFLNGGSQAWIVRAANGASKAALTVENMAGSLDVLDITASSEGLWGNYLRLDVDYGTSNPDSTFNLTVTEYASNGTQLVVKRTESHRNLSMDARSAQYAVNVVNSASALVQLKRNTAISAATLQGLASGWSESGSLVGFNLNQLDANHLRIAISVNGDPPSVIQLFDPSSPPATLADLALAILPQVKAIKPGSQAYDGFAVAVVGNRLRFTAGAVTGTAQEQSSVRISSAPSQDAAKVLKLGLANSGREAEAAAALRPAPNGNASADLTTVSLTSLPTNTVTMSVATAVATVSTTFSVANIKQTYTEAELSELAYNLQHIIRASSTVAAFSKATVRVIGKRLQ